MNPVPSCPLCASKAVVVIPSELQLPSVLPGFTLPLLPRTMAYQCQECGGRFLLSNPQPVLQRRPPDFTPAA